MNFQHIFSEVETTVGVTVFFDEGVEEDQILDIKSQIEKQDEVDNVHYTSADEAWKEYKEKAFPDTDQNILTNLDNDNPLASSASLEVYLKDAAMQQDLVDYIKGIDGVRSVNASKSVADSFASFGRLLSYVSLAIIVILVGVAVFLISNTVRTGIAVRKEEIGIMKVIGATDYFVRAPFIVEGILIGLIGAAIPLIILHAMYGRIIEYVANRFGFLNNLLTFLPVDTVFQILLPVGLILGVGIGYIGSRVTVRKHINV